MIAIDPVERPTFDSLLHNARGSVFPETFYSFLHNYVASINELSTPSPFSSSQSYPSTTAGTPVTATPSTSKPVASNASHAVLSPDGDRLSDPLPSDSDHRMEKLWSDYESVEPYLLPTNEDGELEDTIKDPVKIEFATPNVAGKPLQVCFAVDHQKTITELCVVGYFPGGAGCP